MSKREQVIVSAALNYALANLDSLNEALEYDDETIQYGGETHKPFTENEVSAILQDAHSVLTDELLVQAVSERIRDVPFRVQLGNALAKKRAEFAFVEEYKEKYPHQAKVQALGLFLTDVLDHPDDVFEACATALEDINYHEEAERLRS